MVQDKFSTWCQLGLQLEGSIYMTYTRWENEAYFLNPLDNWLYPDRNSIHQLVIKEVISDSGLHEEVNPFCSVRCLHWTLDRATKFINHQKSIIKRSISKCLTWIAVFTTTSIHAVGSSQSSQFSRRKCNWFPFILINSKHFSPKTFKSLLSASINSATCEFIDC